MGAGLVVDGRRVPVPGVDVVTWLDDPRACPPVTRGDRRRAADVTAVVLHTSRGRRGAIAEGRRASDKAARLARYQVRTRRKVSWCITVGASGEVFQQCDAALVATWHAGVANGYSVGIELAQDEGTPDLTRAQVDAAVAVVRALCGALAIPSRVPVRPDGSPVDAPVRAWQPRSQGGEALPAAGVIAHRNVTTRRGKGDAGDPVIEALRAAGFDGASPDAMTLRAAAAVATAAPAEVDDEPHDGDDGDDNAPAWPPLPPWIDPALEVDATDDLPDDLAALVRDAAPVLAALGVDLERAAELLAHAATECARGREAHGNNYGGVKLKERDDAAHRAKHGRGLAWWRAPGHVDAGDGAVAYYRAFEDVPAFWAFWLKRYVPRPGSAEGERYAATGAAFWGADPSRWFVELLRAGYRGPVREREILELYARGAADTHPSVAAHRALVARVRSMLST